MVLQRKYDLVIVLNKAGSTFAQGYAGFGVAFSTALDGTIFPTDWESFKRQWPQIVIPLVLALIRAGWNAYKHGALPIAPVIMLACAGMLMGSGPCVTLSASDIAVIGTTVAGVVATGIAAADAHSKAVQDRENADKAFQEALAQSKFQGALAVATPILDRLLPPQKLAPKPATAGAAK